jgi:copper/silver efflux system protein
MEKLSPIQRVVKFSAEHRGPVLFASLLVIIGAWYAAKTISVDALPDLSDKQVVVYSRWDRSPEIVENQVSYPIVRALLGAPKVKTIRAVTDYGYSFVYVIFQDDVDLYWARSRVNEMMGKILATLPAGVKTEIGPDATGLGWVYQYALVSPSGKVGPDRLRAIQDFDLKYQLLSVPGVAEIASMGGFQKQYQIQIDPGRLQVTGLALPAILDKIRSSNQEAGGRLIEVSGAEYMVRSQGYLSGIADINKIALGTDERGNPIPLGAVATVSESSDVRRGVTDLGGAGDTVAGVVIMRQGENAYEVIERVKAKIEDIKKFLPAGVEIVTTYDRSELISHSIKTLEEKLIEEIIVVSLVILLFLWHFPSAIVPILSIPIAVLIAFIPLNLFGISSNIMSLAGIAISIGVLVDGAIVEVENAYKKLEEWNSNGRIGDYHKVRLQALLEVGPSVFFSLLVVAVSFLPVFTLVDQEGRLFKPLAWSKNLTMVVAALLAITVDPALRMLFSRMDPFAFKNRIVNKVANALLVGKYYPEEKHPVSRRLINWYGPVCRFTLRHPRGVIAAAVGLLILTVPLYLRLGGEFFPPLYEESLLYMPTTAPGLSASEAQRLLTMTNKVIAAQPEVARVFGKAGRADSATDPAPLSMIETNILLKPANQWREGRRFYSGWPSFLKPLVSWIFPARISKDELIEILNRELQFPGVTNAFTMPIRNRVDMLSTGMKTPLGLKISGRNLSDIEHTAIMAERLLRDVKGVRSAVAERTASGYFLDIDILRDRIARYDLSIDDVQQFVRTAIGGETLTETIEGRERYAVTVRYGKEWRDSPARIRRLPVSLRGGSSVPLGEIANIEMKTGAGMIRNENGFLTGYVYIDTDTSDLTGLAERILATLKNLKGTPEGISIALSGQYESILRVRERLLVVVPITLFLILLLLYFNTKSYVKTLIVMLAVPFSLVGAVILLSILGYHMSIAVWVGMIALMGLDAETGVFMLMYLDLEYDKHRAQIITLVVLKEVIFVGAVHRLRPKMMTVLAAFCGLLPIMFSRGTGSDIMKAIAAPMVGGLFTSFLLELAIYPPIYYLWKRRHLPESDPGASRVAAAPAPESETITSEFAELRVARVKDSRKQGRRKS